MAPPILLVAAIAGLAGCFSGYGAPTHQADANAGDAAISESCGDGALDGGEACDDGDLLADDGCSPSCQVELGWSCEGEPSQCVELCGNGAVDPGEDCDGIDVDEQDCTTIAGGFTSGTLSCSAQCTFDVTECVMAGCGDSVVVPPEECDDGNADNQDACLNNCRHATCGDGIPWTDNEECDDGGTTSGDGCTSTCDLEYCGDGVVQGGIGEECEGGIRACTTTCSSTGQESCSAGCKWGGCLPPEESCNAVDDDCSGTIDMPSCLSTVYRFYNPSTGDHMFKVNDTTPESGYVSEASNNWRVYANPVAGTAAIYQLSNGTDHMLSSSSSEGVSVGYSLAGTIGYAATSDPFDAAGTAPTRLCRYYNASNGDHLAHRDIAIEGYVQEGCFGYVWDFH